MMPAVEASLKRLQTDYIDLYWVHIWDGITPVEEVTRGLDDLVRKARFSEDGRFDSRLSELGTRRFLPNYNRNDRRVETVWAGLSQAVSNLRWSRASKLQGVVSERFARCERKKLPKGLGFQPLRDMNCSSGYRMPSERIETLRSYLACW
jgi:hypothetical protein